MTLLWLLAAVCAELSILLAGIADASGWCQTATDCTGVWRRRRGHRVAARAKSLSPTRRAVPVAVEHGRSLLPLETAICAALWLRISNRRRQRRRRELLARGGAVLRTAWVIAVVTDVVSALVVDLAAALVLRVAGAAFRAGVGLKSFVIVEALAVVLLEPSCLAPLTAEASAL